MQILVIGGGPAGMMAAGTAASMGAKVCLVEKNKDVGRKLRITGKGRCNLTNACDHEELIANVVSNPTFLHISNKKEKGRKFTLLRPFSIT